MTAPGQAGGEPGLAVERVEVVPAAGGVVHVRVVGLWHGRLLAAPPAVLLAGTGEERRRIDPVPEPREPVGGWAGPRGEWRATFALPERLLAGGVALEIDGRQVPLPGLHGPGEEPAAASPPAGATIVDHPALAERRARGEGAGPDAPMPPPPARRATLAGREAALARGLADPAAAEHREAHATPGREQAPPPGGRLPPPEGDREAAGRVAGLRAQVAAAVQGVAADLEAERAARGALEGELVRERDRRAALEAELARRRVVDARLAAGVAGARVALADAASALAATPPPAPPPSATRERLEALRAQVEALRERSTAERAEPAPGVDPERLGAALARLRATVAPALDAVAEQPPAGEGATESPPQAVEPRAAEPQVAGAVDEAESPSQAVEAPVTGAVDEPDEPEPEPEPEPGVAPWLPAALRALAGQDAEAAGRAVVALLPAQGLAAPGDLDYDLALRKGPSYSVTVRGGATEVLERSAPRPRRERDFAARASLAGLGGWATGRRRRGVRGRRRAGPLRALAGRPLSLAELDAAGVRPDVELAWRLVAVSVDPQWTEGRRLAVRHDVVGLERPTAVVIRAGDGEQLSVGPASGAVRDAVDATIRTTPGAVLAALRGATPPPGEMVEEGGDVEAIAALQRWIARVELGIRPSA